MRSEDELTEAHDRLVGIILHHAPLPDIGLTMRDLNMLAQVLCWVLEHDHNTQFPRTLERIERALKDQGFSLEPKP